MKQSQILWFLLFFIGSSTIQGQAFKVYDEQKLIDAVMRTGLEHILQGDSKLLHQIGTNKVKQFHDLIRQVNESCYSDTTIYKKIRDDFRQRQLDISRIDSLIAETTSYRDSILIQDIDHYLEDCSKKESIHLVEIGSILYYEGPIIDNTKEIITIMRDHGVVILIFQRYKEWLRARTKHYGLD